MTKDVKARLIQVIEVEHIRGGEADSEPLRPVKTYWDLKGSLLAEYDPMSDLPLAGNGKPARHMEGRP